MECQLVEAPQQQHKEIVHKVYAEAVYRQHVYHLWYVLFQSPQPIQVEGAEQHLVRIVYRVVERFAHEVVQYEERDGQYGDGYPVLLGKYEELVFIPAQEHAKNVHREEVNAHDQCIA